MQPTQRPLVVALAVILALSGCLGAFTGDPTTSPDPTGDETVDIEVAGNATGSPLLTVYFYNETPDDVTLAFANDTTRRVAVTGQPGVDQRAVPDSLRRVEVGQDVVHGINFEGRPPFQMQARDLPKIRTVVYAVYERRGGRVVGWGVVRCDAHVSRISLSYTAGNASVGAVGCEG